MIDYVLTFESETNASRDPALADYYNSQTGDWRGDCVIPNIVCSAVAVGPEPIDTKFRLLIAQAQPSGDLMNHIACEFAYDRDNAMVLKFTLGDPADYSYSPQFAGTPPLIP